MTDEHRARLMAGERITLTVEGADGLGAPSCRGPGLGDTMSHFAVVVLLEPRQTNDIEGQVSQLLEPYNENGEWFAEGGRWDWWQRWQIGGRWTGALDGYDPEVDPANFEQCAICMGTGVRPGGREQFGAAWAEQTGGCNGCGGKGTRLSWPTNWADHPGDRLPIEQVRDSFIPLAVVTPDGKWHEEAVMGWWGVEREREESAGDWQQVWSGLKAAYVGCTAVVVDCHV